MFMERRQDSPITALAADPSLMDQSVRLTGRSVPLSVATVSSNRLEVIVMVPFAFSISVERGGNERHHEDHHVLLAAGP